jgi:hypothetical protein
MEGWWLLVVALAGAPAIGDRRPAPDRPRLTLAPALAPIEALDVAPVALDPVDAMRVVASLAPRMLHLRPNGWLAIDLDRDLSVLLDLRIDSLPTSVDPARPDTASGLAGRIAVELRPEIEIRL